MNIEEILKRAIITNTSLERNQIEGVLDKHILLHLKEIYYINSSGDRRSGGVCQITKEGTGFEAKKEKISPWILENDTKMYRTYTGSYEFYFEEGCNIPEGYIGTIFGRKRLLTGGNIMPCGLYPSGYKTDSIGAVCNVGNVIEVLEGAPIAHFVLIPIDAGHPTGQQIVDMAIVDFKNATRKENIQPNSVDLNVVGIKRLNAQGGSIYKNKTVVANSSAVELYDSQHWFLEPGVYEAIFDQSCKIPVGYYGEILPRSSLTRNGCYVKSGIFDSGYQTEHMACSLHVNNKITIEHGARIATFNVHHSNESFLYNGQFQNK